MKTIILLIALWVCGAKSLPPVKYYSATGSTKSEASINALNLCELKNPDCELVGCKQISPGER